jgi:hypothetical protein
MPPPASSGGSLSLQPLFPLAVGQVQLRPDPLETALQLREILRLRGDADGNPMEGCAWTGDLNNVWQLHRHPTFAPLLRQLLGHAGGFLEQLGFDRSRLALHLQRCWPVVSEPGQVVGRHHHPNAHLSGVYYLNGDGSGRSGCLRLFPPGRPNELVPGLAVGHDGPIDPDSAGACHWNAPWVDLAPQAGLLVLFPASVDHAVLENEDPEESRFSISFDLVLSAPRAGARGTGDAADCEGGGIQGAAPPEYLAPHPADWQELEAEISS